MNVKLQHIDISNAHSVVQRDQQVPYRMTEASFERG